MTTASGSARSMVRSAELTALVLRSKVPSAAQFHAALFQRALDAPQAVPAEGIVLVEDGDPAEMQILGEMLDPRLGLGAVAGANVDDVVRSGERRNRRR